MPLKSFVSDLRKKASQKVNLHQSQLFYFEEQAVLYGPVGASACVSTLEKIRLGNLKEIIVLSYCGSLSESLKIGQAFYPFALSLTKEHPAIICPERMASTGFQLPAASDW